MEEEIPRINFDKSKSLGIEVVNFTQLLDALKKTKNHDPFSVHRIEFFLILIVTKGSYSHFVDFTFYTLSEGCALFVAKNQIHHFTRKIQSCEGFCIIFRSLFNDNKDHFLSNILRLNRLFNYRLESPIIPQKEIGEDHFIDIATALYYEYTFSNNFAKTDILRSLLQVLLLKAERAKEFQSVRGIKAHWLEIFNKFKELLEREYINTRKSRVYASKLFVSYKFLNEIIRRVSGKTAKVFIDDFVTIEIKRYLVSTPLSIKEVSYKTGFEEPANMIKFFKKRTGKTPLQFRRES
ncbi:MAG: helix-turn-helix transcriptional regulator [Bacteroidota bacterium]